MTDDYKTDYPGTRFDWNGFEARSFMLDTVKCTIVNPSGTVAPGKPWYWRARFFGAFPYPDLALLKRGYHVVNIDVPELYGGPESQRRFDLFYRFMIDHGFKKRCVLVGYSRGGLDVYEWSSRNTDKVSCLYLDNPVCDFKSWPGGKGKGPGEEQGWKNCLAAWNFTEEEAMNYQGNPIDRLSELAAAHIPLLHLCGTADEVVPPEENTMIVEKRYRELGGEIEVIYKPGAKHHPHSLENPQPILDFIAKHDRM